jgi:hypothetical protein
VFLRNIGIRPKPLHGFTTEKATYNVAAFEAVTAITIKSIVFRDDV